MPEGASGQPSWVMPATVEVDPPGSMRFFFQPRWADGAYSDWGPFRRRDMPAFTELEVELTFHDGSAVGVVYLMPSGDSTVEVVTSFESFFQPLRRLLYGPNDERDRQKLWQGLQQFRPLFMAVTHNGLVHRFHEAALMQRADPSDGSKKNLVVSHERGRTLTPEPDHALVNRSLEMLGIGLQLVEESMVPLDLNSVYLAAGSSVDLLGAAGSAAKWLLKNAGEIADLIDLIDELTD